MNFCHRVFGFSLGMGFERGKRKTPWRKRGHRMAVAEGYSVARHVSTILYCQLATNMPRDFNDLLHHNMPVPYMTYICGSKVFSLIPCTQLAPTPNIFPLPLQGARPKFLHRPFFGAMRRACSQGALEC